MLGVWLNGSRHYFISCAQNCGETFDALQYVRNYRVYGFKYALVQDMATSAEHPLLYTHNVNIAGIIFTLLDAAGVRPFWAKQLIILAAFGAGLFYVYRATAYHTRSWLAGIILVLFFSTDYEHVLSFGLNALRAWHWLAIFGLLFHVGRLCLEPAAAGWLDRIAIVVFAALSFGVGYDFWVICLLMNVLLALSCVPGKPWSREPFRMIAGICAAFALPFVIRQIQIASVLGLHFWALDMYYSAVIKISVLNKLLHLPPIDEIDRFYAAAHVLRPPATPASSFGDIAGTLGSMIRHVTIPTVGSLGVALTLAVGAVAVAVTFLPCFLRPRALVGLLALLGIRGHDRRRFLGALRLMAALMLGIAGGMAVFAPLSFHIYLKHQFPLVAAPVLLAKALVIMALAEVFSRWCCRQKALRWLTLGAMCFVIMDHGIVQVDDLRVRSPVDVSWIGFVSGRREASFAVWGLPPSWVEAFTHKWVESVPFFGDQQTRDIQGDEGKTKAKAEVYLRRDFWLFAVADMRPQFDRPSPMCRQDYLVMLLQRMVRRNVGTVPTGALRGLWPERVAPGGIISVVGELKPVGRSVARVRIMSGGRVAADLTYNFQYKTFWGTFQVPGDVRPGVTFFQIRMLDREGHEFVIAELSVTVDAAAPPASLPPLSPPVQPTVDEIVAANQKLKIAERGSTYVIFDLRPSYGWN